MPNFILEISNCIQGQTNIIYCQFYFYAYTGLAIDKASSWNLADLCKGHRAFYSMIQNTFLLYILDYFDLKYLRYSHLSLI